MILYTTCQEVYKCSSIQQQITRLLFSKSERWQVKGHMLCSEICAVTVVKTRHVKAPGEFFCMLFRKVFLKMVFELNLQRYKGSITTEV